MFWVTAILAGTVLGLLFHIIFRHPRCADCGAKAMPNMTHALIQAQHRLEKCEIALRRLYDDTADYIIVNNLGDVHHNKAMQMAREALRSSSH